ncbi:hypothetical protein ACFQU3_08900 [Terrabacter sp. GCM10028922]|uniref:hypothetical protein n=1 Tax=Terrabacter sp. GCM10028922 TaxID=3273428 RepID=UPI00361967E3
MSDGLAPGAQTSRRRWTAAVVVTIGYFSIRALNFWELWFASSAQAASGPANPLGNPSDYFVQTPTPASPGLGGLLTNWDGQWYERIAVDGYPTGAEARSANDAWTWAFPPLFPMLVRLVMALTGLGFPAASVVLNLVLGGVATALLYCLLRASLSGTLATAGALSLSVFMSAPLFGLAYSEPAALVLLLVALRATLAQRYTAGLLAVILLAFTRPVAVPLAAVFAVHWWLRWRSRRTAQLGPGTHLILAANTLAAMASPFLWNAIATVCFGSAASPAEQSDSPLSGVARTASMISTFEFGWLGGVWRIAGTAGVLLVILVAGLALGLAVTTSGRLGLPIELRVWGVTYTAFVLLVTPPTPGLIRYLLLAAPLLIAVHVQPLAWRKRAAGLVLFGVITAVGLWSQWFWIRYLYILDPAPAQLPWPP